MNLLKELDMAKASICKYELNDETLTEKINKEVNLGVTEFENSKTNLYTNLHTKSTTSLKKASEKNKSLFNSLEDFRLEETNSEIEQELDTNISKEKYKFFHSSSVECTPKFKSCKIDVPTPRYKGQNISEFNIDFNCKKKEIEELFDDGMEKLINSLRASKADDTKKNLISVEKFNNETDINILSKADQRRKLPVLFKSNCNENKKMPKSMNRNTQLKVKNFMAKKSNQANGQQNGEELSGKLESDSILIISKGNCHTSEKKEKGKNLKENKTKLYDLNRRNKRMDNKNQYRNNSVSMV